MTTLRRCLPLLAALALLLPAASMRAGAILDGPNVRITDAGLGQYDDAELPDLAVLGNSVYATWLDDRSNEHASVFFARSADGGATWGENVLVSALPYDDWANNPQIAVQPDGTLWIVWHLFYAADSNEVNDLRIARSTDGGATWTRYDLRDGPDEGEDLWKMRIAADKQNVYILYHDYTSSDAGEGYEIYLDTLDAATLDVSSIRVNDVRHSARLNSSFEDGPLLDFALRETERGSVMCAAWEDQRERFALFSACSTDGGATFSPSVALSPADAVNPHIALAPDGTLYATYSLDGDSDNNIILRKSSDLGQSWSEPQQLTDIDAADEVASWDLAVDSGGQIVLPWVEAFYGESNLNLATSSDGGASFATLVDIEDDQGEYPTVSDQREVAVALGSGEGADERAYIAWRDDRNVQDEIWFIRATLDGTPPTAPTNVQAQPGDTVIALSWQAATDANGVSGYRIYRAPDNGSGSADGPFVQISPLLVRGTDFVDVGLSADQPYLYQIAAVDGTGNLSPRSAVVSAAATVGDVQPSGTLVYERNDAVRLKPLVGGEESAIADAYEPVLSTDGTRLYYRSGDSIGVRSVEGNGVLGEPQPFFTREGLADFDVAADGAHFAMLVQRFQANLNSGGCFVFEPIYASASQDLYTDQYNYSSYVSISADRRWMAYRYDGFCTINASGFTEPSDFCIANLSTQEKKCIEGANVDGSDFAPSGSDLVFASPASGQHEIWRAQVADDGSLVNPVQLTSGPANQPADNPRFSSDGQWITFQRDVNPDTADDAEEWRLYAVRADGTSLRDLGVAGEGPVLLSGGSAPDATSTPAPGTTPAPQPTAQPTSGPTPTPLPEGVGTRTYLPVVAR